MEFALRKREAGPGPGPSRPPPHLVGPLVPGAGGSQLSARRSARQSRKNGTGRTGPRRAGSSCALPATFGLTHLPCLFFVFVFVFVLSCARGAQTTASAPPPAPVTPPAAPGRLRMAGAVPPSPSRGGPAWVKRLAAGPMPCDAAVQASTDRRILIHAPRAAVGRFGSRSAPVPTGEQSCGKTISTSFTCSTKHEQNLHGNVKPLQLAPNGSSHLANRTPVLKKQWDLFASSTSVNVVTTFDDNKGVSSSVEEKVGVLLLNLGGPETLDDVQPFLYNLFADPDIIRLPRLFRFLQRPLAKLISTFRAPKSKEGYASIGGGSPLRKITDEQANALKIALEKKNLNANIYVGMRYWYPFTEEAIDQIKKDKITKLVVLPLYPQYSISTSGSSIRVLQNIVMEDAYFSGLPISIIESWYQRDGYVKSMADLIEKELSAFSNPEEVMIFFSAHGVPLTYVEDAGDPYRDQMEDCIALIMGELRSRGILNSHTLAYQSRVGPVQWLKPYTDEVLVELGQKGVKSLLAVPVSFVSEHIETLEEIDMEYKELALESGIQNWGRVPALGCTSTFISDLADAVVEALPSASALVTRKPNDTDSDMDLMHYLTKMFFGSILAFILLLSPRLISAFRNTML